MSSCNSEKIEPNIVERSSLYLPLDNNQEQLFEIYELDYTIFGVDTTHYFKLERTNVLFKDKDSLYAIVNVLTSDTKDGVFSSASAYSLLIERNQVIQNLETERFVVFDLPLKQGNSFDVNAYNLQDKKEGTIISLEKNISTTDFMASNTFNEAMKIQLEKTKNNILSIDHYRVYGKEKGLVYERNESLDQQPGQDPIGYIHLKMRVN